MKKQHGIHWRMPTAMIVCFLIGLGLAIGHHFYYYSLDGTRVGGQSEQEWALRFGTGLAFLTKTFLTTAVGISCIQNFWWILRLKPVRLSTLDSMFDIRGSIFNFFDLHICEGPHLQYSAALMLKHISYRLIPLVTVITPSTLSVQSTVGSSFLQKPIPTMDYEPYKYITRSNGGVGGPSQSLTRQILNSVVQGSILDIPAPAPNSSYTLEFIGPHIQCQNASAYVNQTVNEYMWRTARMRTAYVAFVAGANLTDDLDYVLGGDSIINTWYWHDANETDYAAKLIIAAYDQVPLRTVIECGMYNASYTVNFDYALGQQSVKVVDRKVLNRVLPLREKTLPEPPNEDELFAYTAIMSVLNTILAGKCFSYPEHCAGTQVSSTALVNSRELWSSVYLDQEAPPDLPPLGQAAAQLAENITLSFFSNSLYLQNTTQAQSVNITIYENQTNYLYSQKNLLIGYGVSVFVSLLCVIAGLLTMWDNGLAFTDSFSSILRATRNKKFDEIVPNDSTTGAEPSPEFLSKTRVQWIPATDREGVLAGLKPLPGVAEPEKGESRSPSSSILFKNRVQERKNYQPKVSYIDTSGNGFI
ncbi:hypothetical protein BJX61DRAFT_537806 [Aspergillus egyptiacus]|nr:hypothetical protein BJX61DRAFT_537806 [Aspergillus egyptiacus]